MTWLCNQHEENPFFCDSQSAICICHNFVQHSNNCSSLPFYQRSHWRRQHRSSLCSNQISIGWHVHQIYWWKIIFEDLRCLWDDGGLLCSSTKLSFLILNIKVTVHYRTFDTFLIRYCHRFQNYISYRFFCKQHQSYCSSSKLWHDSYSTFL